MKHKQFNFKQNEEDFLFESLEIRKYSIFGFTRMQKDTQTCRVTLLNSHSCLFMVYKNCINYYNSLCPAALPTVHVIAINFG